MATVQAGPHDTDWEIDGKIGVRNYGRTIRLVDLTTGQVMENIGGIAEAKTRAELLISGGKWAIHENYMATRGAPS